MQGQDHGIFVCYAVQMELLPVAIGSIHRDAIWSYLHFSGSTWKICWEVVKLDWKYQHSAFGEYRGNMIMIGTRAVIIETDVIERDWKNI